jgi:hypothetical protein
VEDGLALLEMLAFHHSKAHAQLFLMVVLDQLLKEVEGLQYPLKHRNLIVATLGWIFL